MSLVKVISSASVLSNAGAAMAAQSWLSGKTTLPYDGFYPYLESLLVICNLEPGSKARRALSKEILEGIEEELEAPINELLVNWYLNDYVGESLANEIHTIILESGFSFHHTEELTDALFKVYENSLINAYSFKPENGPINDWFKSLLGTINKGYIKAFETYLAFMETYEFHASDEAIFKSCIGSSEGAYFAELLATETLEITDFDDLPEMAKHLDLHYLEFYSEDELPCVRFSSDFCDFDRSVCLDALEKIVKESPDVFMSLLSIGLAEYSESCLNDAFLDHDCSQTVALLSDSLLLTNIPERDKAEVLYALIVTESVFDKQIDLLNAYQQGEAYGAESEMIEALEKHSIFELNEKLEQSEYSFKLVFSLPEVLRDINRNGDLFNYYSIDDFMDAKSFLHYMIFSERITSNCNDFAVPQYGFSGFDVSVFEEEILTFIKELIEA